MGNAYREDDCVGSVPSKPRAVKSCPEKRGFSSQAKRFTSLQTESPGPGPGCYNFCSSDLNCPSFSTRGTTGFVPSTEAPPELSYPQRHVPAPNTYNLQGSFINKHDYNTGVSRVFRSPVAVRRDSPKIGTPAPNHYKIQYGSSERFGPSVSSVFVSKTKRNPFNINKDLPSPSQYYVDDDSQRVSTAMQSPFRSKTQRLTGPKDNHFPGPAAYSPHIPAPVKRTNLRPMRGLTISAAPFILPKPPPTPGPGHYQVSTGMSSKWPVPSAAFASKSGRMSQARRTNTPGPGFYDPHVSSKQSFLYSGLRIWRPI